MADAAHPIADLVEAVVKAQESIEQLEQRIAVLFADLCDSTSYKQNRGDLDGLLKTYRHNQIVGAAVIKRGGHIVKYIGDEVMVTFSGDDAAERAAGAALDIQGTIRLVNERIKGSPDERIRSKIGINFGTALLVHFPGHEEKDPQGKVVDAAARIVAVCQPGQILCSEAVKAALPATIVLSEPHIREAKGIAGGVQIFEILQNGNAPQTPKRIRHSDTESPAIRDAIMRASIYEYTGNAGQAIGQYETVLNSDKAHFAANYRKARVLFRHRDALRARYEEIIALSRQATDSFPDSGVAKAFHLVMGWAREHSGSAKSTLTPDHCDQMIAEARRALELCQQDGDLYGEMVAMNFLAFFISEQLAEQPASAAADGMLLQEARDLCAAVQNMIKDLESNFFPAFYETYATVLGLSKNRSDVDRAIELAKQSSEMRETARVLRTRAELLEKRDKMPN